jgi:tetratricopeptide (TPR) repeat protein
MGSVYLGVRDDAQYEKQVAIKLLKRGLDTDFMLNRFRQERQILADLEHPFIARLLDGGATEDGLPYFVMEYVDGLPITKYCTEKNLSVVERLRLFRLVCEAVQHAHQRLVVHRDIKPSNILTTREGVPKLLDFGIAKVIDPGRSPGTTLTQPEQRMLTPDYASPEQVKGLAISTASDIYSLGVVLYELLTGRVPYRLASSLLAELEKTICEVDPEKPSLAAGKQLRRQLAGDLDAIILTAMRKEPQRRYASAAEFSEDLRRHMEGLPIVAQEDRWGYRAGKFIRRNRLGVTAALLVMASLVGGMLATTYQARRAERRFQIVRGLANSVLFDLHDQVQQLPGSTRARAAMVETVLHYLDNLATDAGQDAGLKLEMAKAYHRIAAIEGHPQQPNLGRTAAARIHYKKALEMLTPLAADARTRSSAIEEMTRINIETGDIELGAGNLEAAKALFQNAGALVDSSEVSPDTEVLAHSRLGEIEAQQGAAGAAVPHFRKALERAQAWADTSRQAQALRSLRAAYSRLANASRESGDLYACRDNLRKTQELVEDRLRQPDQNIEDRRNLLVVHASLAELYGGPDDLNLGEHDVALTHYRTAVALAEKFVAADPHDVRARRDLAIHYRRLGRMLCETDPAEAMKYYVPALEIAEDLRKSDPSNIDFRRDVSEANLGLAILARKSGRNDEAMERLARALELQKSIEAAAPNRIWVGRYITQIYTEIGNVLMMRGDTTGALNSYREALAAAERLLMRAPSSLYLERDRADVLEAMGKYFLKLSLDPNLKEGAKAQFEAQARLQESLRIWQSWTQRKIGAPYAARREAEAGATLASIRKKQ